MKYIEAFSTVYPNTYPKGSKYTEDIALFLAGGITNCADWQQDVVKLLSDYAVTILNPRRANYPHNDPNATEAQIKWEFEHLDKADILMFWFAPETLCPITLFEYGKWLVTEKPIFVGCDPKYARRDDIIIQTKLEYPNMVIHNSIVDVVDNIKYYLENH